MRTVQFTLPLVPPSVNGIFANIPGLGRRKTKAYRSWRKDTEMVLRAKRITAFDGVVGVDIILPRSTRGDADNRVKAVLDALQGAGIISDDKHCDPIRVGRGDVLETTIILRSEPGAPLTRVHVHERH